MAFTLRDIKRPSKESVEFHEHTGEQKMFLNK